MARQLAARFFLVLIMVGWQSSIVALTQEQNYSSNGLTQIEGRKFSQDLIALLKKNNEAKGTPFYHRTLFKLGEEYWKQALVLNGDTKLVQKAEEKWSIFLEEKETNEAWKSRANFALGEIRFWQKNYHDAISCYNRVQSRQKIVTDLKQYLSRLEGLSYKMLEKQETELLLKEYQTQADLKVEAQSRKILCLIQLQNYEQARIAIEKILPEATVEQRKILEYQRILSWLLENKDKQAEEFLIKLEKQYGQNPFVEEGVWILAQQLLGKKKTKEAIFYLNKLKQDYPRGTYSNRVLSLLEQLQEIELSKATVDQKELIPSQAELFKKALSVKKSDPQQARNYCDAIIAAENQATELKAQAMWLAGEILSEQKEYDKAAGYFEMIEIFLGDIDGAKAIEGLWRAGQLYEKAGMLSEARRAYRLLIEHYPQSDFYKQAQHSLAKIETSL